MWLIKRANGDYFYGFREGVEDVWDADQALVITDGKLLVAVVESLNKAVGCGYFSVHRYELAGT